MPKDQPESVKTGFNAEANPLKGIKPLFNAQIQDVPLDVIDLDPTNPGLSKDPETPSLRYRRRAPNLVESLEVLGMNVNPVITTQQSNGRQLLVEGHGRFDAISQTTMKTIRALIYPEMSLAQRVHMRQMLNAAQAEITASYVLHDLRLLAADQKLDYKNEADLDKLLAGFPDRVRERREDFMRIARWPESVLTVLAEEGVRGKTVGIDMLRNLDDLINELIEKPKTKASTEFPGFALYDQILKMYFQGAFRGKGKDDALEGKSAANCRSLYRAVRDETVNPNLVTSFLKGSTPLSEVLAAVKKPQRKPDLSNDPVQLATRLLTLVLQDTVGEAEKSAVVAQCNLVISKLAPKPAAAAA